MGAVISLNRSQAPSDGCDELVKCLKEADLDEIAKLVSLHAPDGRRLLVKKINRKGDRALHLAAGHSSQSVKLVEGISKMLLLQSQDAMSKGEHIDENFARSIGRALFGQPERYQHMTQDEIAADGVAYVSNKSNNKGQTPLMAACEVGNTDAAMLLLSIGADPWKGDGVVGRTCLHFAAGRGHSDCIRTIVAFVQSLSQEDLSRKYRVAHVPKIYLESGNVHDIPTASGLTPLAYAAWHGQRRCIEILCELGASLYSTSWMRGLDPECRECLDGSTPLHLAALRGSLRTIKVLLRCYVKQVEERDRQARDPDRPPLTPLSNHPFIRVQQMQLRELPDIRLTADSHGLTPTDIARFRGHHPAVVRALDPSTPLSAVLAEDEAQERALGPPRLTEIVSKLYRGILLMRLDELRNPGPVTDDNSVGNSIRGGMEFLNSLARTSSKASPSPIAGPSNPQPHRAASARRSLTTSFLGGAHAPVGVKGSSDDEDEDKKDMDRGSLMDTVSPLPVLQASRPPLPPSHTRGHSRGVSVGDRGSIMEDLSTSVPITIHQESSWVLHPMGSPFMRVSGTPTKEGGAAVASITVKGVFSSPNIEMEDNPVFARQNSQPMPPAVGGITLERGKEKCISVHGGSHYYNPQNPHSIHHAASAGVAAALAASHTLNPAEAKELQAAAEQAASSQPEAIAATAMRMKRMTGDRSNRGSLLGDSHVCSVCLDDDADGGQCLFLQVASCNHTLCIDCASELLKHSEYKPALCPLCRGYIKSFDKFPASKSKKHHQSRTTLSGN